MVELSSRADSVEMIGAAPYAPAAGSGLYGPAPRSSSCARRVASARMTSAWERADATICSAWRSASAIAPSMNCWHRINRSPISASLVRTTVKRWTASAADTADWAANWAAEAAALAACTASVATCTASASLGSCKESSRPLDEASARNCCTASTEVPCGAGASVVSRSAGGVDPCIREWDSDTPWRPYPEVGSERAPLDDHPFCVEGVWG